MSRRGGSGTGGGAATPPGGAIGRCAGRRDNATPMGWRDSATPASLERGKLALEPMEFHLERLVPETPAPTVHCGVHTPCWAEACGANIGIYADPVPRTPKLLRVRSQTIADLSQDGYGTALGDTHTHTPMRRVVLRLHFRSP